LVPALAGGVFSCDDKCVISKNPNRCCCSKEYLMRPIKKNAKMVVTSAAVLALCSMTMPMRAQA
jgi:hypothetical protein